MRRPPVAAPMWRITAWSWIVVCLMVVVTGVPSSRAGDWPQILGPTRTGQALDERLADTWPESGPAVRWQHPVGRGFAGVAVAGGRVVVFHRQGDQDVVESLDADTGQQHWKTLLPARYVASYTTDDGPRCVPLIHQGFIYLRGADDDLTCLRADNGRKVWSRALAREYRIPESYFGAGSTPVVHGDRLLLNTGGLPDAGLMAVSLADGKTLWHATDERAGYSSPVVSTQQGQHHAIFVTRYHLLSVDPVNGQVRWRLPFGQRGPTVNAATPLVLGDRVFVSASYGVGALLARIRADEAEPIWSNDHTMSSQYATCVHHDGLLYGVDGRQDIGVARLRCFDPLTGAVRWTEEGFGMATLILADDKLIITKTDGQIILARASAEAYQPLARAQAFQTTVQALSALSDGQLYARDTGVLKCLRLIREQR